MPGFMFVLRKGRAEARPFRAYSLLPAGDFRVRIRIVVALRLHQLTQLWFLPTIPRESAYGPVAVLVFKTSGRGDELRQWVRLPHALANT